MLHLRQKKSPIELEESIKSTQHTFLEKLMLRSSFNLICILFKFCNSTGLEDFSFSLSMLIRLKRAILPTCNRNFFILQFKRDQEEKTKLFLSLTSSKCFQLAESLQKTQTDPYPLRLCFRGGKKISALVNLILEFQFFKVAG